MLIKTILFLNITYSSGTVMARYRKWNVRYGCIGSFSLRTRIKIPQFSYCLGWYLFVAIRCVFLQKWTHEEIENARQKCIVRFYFFLKKCKQVYRWYGQPREWEIYHFPIFRSYWAVSQRNCAVSRAAKVNYPKEWMRILLYGIQR